MEITINGNTVTVERLTPSQILDHIAGLRDFMMMEAVRQMAQVHMPLDLAKHAWDQARQEARAIDWGTSEYIAATMTRWGLIHRLHLAVKDKCKCSFKDVADLFVNPNYGKAAALATFGLNLVDGETQAA